MEVEQLEHGLGRQDALAVPALEEDDVVAHVVGEVVALPFLYGKNVSSSFPLQCGPCGFYTDPDRSLPC